MNTQIRTMPFTRPESGCGGSLCIFIYHVWKAGVNWHSFVQSMQDLMLRDWACPPQETAPTSCEAVQSWVFYSPPLQCCLQWKLVTQTKKNLLWNTAACSILCLFSWLHAILVDDPQHTNHTVSVIACAGNFSPLFFRILLNRPQAVLDLFLITSILWISFCFVITDTIAIPVVTAE